MAKQYNFQYTPLTGRLPGNSFVKQTEQAINELAGIVNEGSAQVEVITNLANQANNNAEEALEKANEALSTASRVYITLPNLSDADDYYNSELYYFANSYSANLPVQDTGFLEVKTNDTKTACEQVFIADLTGLCYFRHGTITSAEVGSETVYSVTWSTWSSELASEDYVQGELLNYLPLRGGTVTGNLDVTGAITGNSVTVNSVNVESGSVAPVNTLQRSTAYSVDDIVYTSALNAKYYLLCVTAGTTASTLPSFSGAMSNTQITDGTVVWRVQTITSQEKAAGVPIGFEYFSMNPNIPQGSLPLIGGVYSRSTYADLWAWVQTQTGYLKTEAEWQTLSTANNGNVPFYSSGDGSTTFRVPSLHCWIKGSDGSAQLVGSYLQAGLPNITAYIQAAGATAWQNASGALALAEPNATVAQAAAVADGQPVNLSFDASRSSAIYGNANTVQPESIVGMWLVKCYGTVADTGTIDEKAYMDEQLALNVPVGCVQAFAGQTTPQGWLLCDGSAISRTQYSKLFGVIGTSYGAGDGSATFNLPNLTDKFIEGSATSGTEHSAGLPNITGNIIMHGSSEQGTGGTALFQAYGAFNGNDVQNNYPNMNNILNGGATSLARADLDASRSSSVYGNSNTVQPPSVTMRYIIKY